jgi:hypothetical protein
LIQRNNYVTYEDICKIFPNDDDEASGSPKSLIVLKTNQDTIIECPEPLYVILISIFKLNQEILFSIKKTFLFIFILKDLQ